jgi:glutaredoxin 3
LAKVLMYTKTVCAYCTRAKNLLNAKDVSYEEINVDHKPPEFYENLKKQTGWMTVPQIFINDKLIGGYDDLKALDQAGKLDQLLGQ